MTPLHLFGVMAVGGLLLTGLLSAILWAGGNAARRLRKFQRWFPPYFVSPEAGKSHAAAGRAALPHGAVVEHNGDDATRIRASGFAEPRSVPLAWHEVVAKVIRDDQAIQRAVERARCVPRKQEGLGADEQRIQSIIGDYAASVAARISADARHVTIDQDGASETVLISRWEHDMHTLCVLRIVLRLSTASAGARSRNDV